MYSRRPKTKLLAALINALRKAVYARKKNIPPAGINEYLFEQRRRFLKNTGKAIVAAGLADVLESCHRVLKKVPLPPPGQSGSSANAFSNSPKIVIVGAGIAGLHAGYVLKQKGYNAQLYEGSSRVSGRIYSAQNILGNGLTTELGGEFLDSSHTDMLGLAKTFNLDLIDTRIPGESALMEHAYFFNGIHYSEQQVIHEFSHYAKRIEADILSLSDAITVDQHTKTDMLFDNLSIAAYFDRIGLKGWLRELLDVAYTTEYGQPTHQQTSINFLFLIKPETDTGHFEIFGDSDERYKIRGGNQQVCEQLAQQLGGQINLGHELISIRQKNNNSYDIIFTADRTTKTINCDILLLAIPFTLLKNVSVQPPWPDWKQHTISNLGYGNNSKLMMGFQKRYWRELGYQGYFFTDSLLQNGWDNSLLQSPVAGGLTVFLGGDRAFAVGNGDIPSQVDIHLPLLDKLYPGAVANYNNKAARFIWPTFKWTKASYSCFYPGQYCTIAGNEIKPVGNIYFAGEHCSYNFQGYMNGGAVTGRRAAENIIFSLQRKTS